MPDISKNINGIIHDIFQIGIDGPIVKNNSGVVEFRNSTDSAYANVRGNDVIGQKAVFGASSHYSTEKLRVVGKTRLEGSPSINQSMEIRHTYSGFGSLIGLYMYVISNASIIPKTSRGIYTNLVSNGIGFSFNPFSNAYAIQGLVSNSSNSSGSGGLKAYAGHFTASGNDANYATSQYSYLYGVFGTIGGKSSASYMYGVYGYIPDLVTGKYCKESYAVYGLNSESTSGSSHYGGYFVSDGSAGNLIGVYAKGANGAFWVDTGRWMNGGNLALGATSFSGSEMLRVVGTSRFEGQAQAQNVVPFTTNTYDLGTTSLRWNNIYGTSLNVTSLVCGHIVPIADSAYDLGTTSVRWRYGYFDDMKVGSLQILGSGSPARIVPTNGFQLGETGGPVQNLYVSEINNPYNTADIDVEVKGGKIDINTDTNQVDTGESFRVQHESVSKFSIKRVDAVTDDACFTLGSYHLWVDSTGDLRIKSSIPTSDTDGVVVGSQS